VSRSDVVTIAGPRFSIQGKSRAGNETWFRIRELGVALDVGRCPDSLVGVPNLLVTHAHLDHALGIPYYAAQRRLQRLAPGNVYLPAEAIDDYRELMKLHEKLEGTEYPLNLIAAAEGDEFDLRRDLTVRIHRSTHRVVTNAYELRDRRVKLDGEYLQLPAEEIAALRSSSRGFHLEAASLLYYTGDTDRRTLEDNDALYRAEVLIIECSFTQPGDQDRAFRYAHIHIDDLFERESLFQNEMIILSHFSLRNSPQEIHRTIGNRCPESLRSRLRFVLPEPYTSLR
jgi:ribonuclease Z